MVRLCRFILAPVALVLAVTLAAWAGAGDVSLKRGAATAGTTRTGPGATRPAGPDCARTSVGFTPLNELGKGRYKGYQGGLYPGGSNTPPKRYLRAGLAAAARVRPLSGNGMPSRSGRIVVLSVGMSIAYLDFRSFLRLAATQPVRAGQYLVAGTLTARPRVELVNGATPTWDAPKIINNEASYLGILHTDLAAANVTSDQVQAVWLYDAIGNENQPFPADSQALERDLNTIIAMLRGHFPNLRLVYVSSREYAGYAVTTTNPEPYAYESGFAVKWTVAGGIAHRKSRPWIAWGPYTWADGTQPDAQSGGLTWSCSDFEPDGTHPLAQGAQKVGDMLQHFFTTTQTARTWF